MKLGLYIIQKITITDDHFPFLSSNIPQSPAYGVYVSQLIRYARASSAYLLPRLSTVGRALH